MTSEHDVAKLVLEEKAEDFLREAVRLDDQAAYLRTELNRVEAVARERRAQAESLRASAASLSAA